MSSVAEIVKAARDRAGMSQDALAAASGLTGNGIGNIESGKSKRPYAATLLAIARALGFATWEDVRVSVSGESRASRGQTMIPVLADVPASQGCDGDVQEAYGYEDAIDWMPASYGDPSDPRVFGLNVRGDSMLPEFPDGAQVTCSPKHWQDYGFIEGEIYAVRLIDNGTTIKRVHLVDDRGTIDLIPTNPDHATKRYEPGDVALAALILGVYKRRKMPEV